MTQGEADEAESFAFQVSSEPLRNAKGSVPGAGKAEPIVAEIWGGLVAAVLFRVLEEVKTASALGERTAAGVSQKSLALGFGDSLPPSLPAGVAEVGGERVGGESGIDAVRLDAEGGGVSRTVVSVRSRG